MGGVRILEESLGVRNNDVTVNAFSYLNSNTFLAWSVVSVSLRPEIQPCYLCFRFEGARSKIRGLGD